MGANSPKQIRARVVRTLKSPFGATAIGVGAALVVLAVLGLAPRIDPDPTAIVTPAAVAAEPPRAASVPAPLPSLGEGTIVERREAMLAGTFEHLDTEGWLTRSAGPFVAGASDEMAPSENETPGDAVASEPLALRGSVDANARATEPPDPATDPAVAQDAAAVAEPQAETAAVAEAPTEGVQPADDTRTVKGAGVTVRSGPSKSNKRLFALPGGADVKVTENRKGWLHVVDGKGRAGWVYSDYVR